MVGRSNVGKSSLINALLGNNTARVSKTPGRTREINVFSFDLAVKGKKATGIPPLYLFDLPGYGFAEVSKEMGARWGELMTAFFSHIPPTVLMLNVQDARHPAQDADQSFHEYFDESELDLVLLFNKIDKLKTQKERSQLEKVKPLLAKEFPRMKQMFFVSAEKNTGLFEVEKFLTLYFLEKVEEQKKLRASST